MTFDSRTPIERPSNRALPLQAWAGHIVAAARLQLVYNLRAVLLVLVLKY